MGKLLTKLEASQCSLCKRCMEYQMYCKVCKLFLCVYCKEKHVIDLDTKYHDVVNYHLENRNFMLTEFCREHPRRIYKYWCQSCEYPICDFCNEHQRHTILDITSAYNTKRQQDWDGIVNTRSEVLLYNHEILAGIKSDFKTCQAALTELRLKMTSSAKRQKTLIDIALKNTKEVYFYINSKVQQSRHGIKIIEMYLLRFENSANRAVQSLLFIKKKPIPIMKNIPKIFTFSLKNEINTEDASLFQGKIELSETRKRRVQNERLLKLMTKPVLKKIVTVQDACCGSQVSFATSEQLWVSGSSTNLYLIDSDGKSLHHRTDKQNLCPGSHTVSLAGELIYIDLDYNICKLCKDNKTKITLMNKSEPWKPQEIYCSQFSGDLLVLMKKYSPSYPINNVDAKVVIFNGLEEKQTFQFDDKGHKLYIDPECITENRNGDVIVFDLIHDCILGPSCLVVTDRNGSHRFTYYGSEYDPQLKLEPCGICTDALSNILIANQSSSTVHMIDKDGKFLSLLLTKEHGISGPWGISYEERSHLLWVGSIKDNRLCVYRYIERQNHLV